MNLPAGIGRTRWPLYVLMGLVEIVVMYLVFRFLIVKMNFKTPGREDGEEVTDLAANAAAVKQQIRSGAAEKTAASANDAQTAAHIVEGLGGAENILNTDNCMTVCECRSRMPLCSRTRSGSSPPAPQVMW